ncbi:class I SAM-dependent methyltransferase [Massilia cavernae]|uniref:Class I SAM-dependent methyltransferase n=1 Tax=Massilia cavernae TaxID=2320864 RepID=A0A418XRB1_9BURK|nr:class I SAM-dependent methyltransferase [Massilia cavernae]RJG15069.1 class I SAM-dependent methyltransferase [Massilia cavernae]
MSLALLRIWRTPALQALLIQAGAAAPMLAAVFLLARAGVSVSYLGVAAIHGLAAAALTWWRGLAPWWRAIQFLFPLALYGALQAALPSWLFAAAFLFLLALYWSTFRTQVPYYPSGKPVWEEVARLLPQGRPVAMIDIGSGLGGLVLELARRRPDSAFTGIELAPLPWLASRLRAWLSGSRARFVRGDYEHLDFAGFDVVFAYLSPAAMGALWRKCSREMQPGSMLVSYEFLITEKAPDISIQPKGCRSNIYAWHF